MQIRWAAISHRLEVVMGAFTHDAQNKTCWFRGGHGTIFFGFS